MRGKVRCAGGIKAVQAARAGRRISQRAQRRAVGGREQAAGARGKDRRRCSGIAQQCSQQRRLAPVKLVGALAEQRQRRSADPLRFAAKRREIEIGLKDLVLAPPVFERPRSAHLAQFIKPPARARPADLGPQEGGGLHRDGRSAAAARALAPGPHRSGQGQPIDPAVAGEAVILRRDDIAAQRGADRGERGPGQPPHREIDPHFVKQAAIAIIQPRLARFPASLKLGKIRRFGRCRAPIERHPGQRQQRREREQHAVPAALRQVG